MIEEKCNALTEKVLHSFIGNTQKRTNTSGSHAAGYLTVNLKLRVEN